MLASDFFSMVKDCDVPVEESPCEELASGFVWVAAGFFGTIRLGVLGFTAINPFAAPEAPPPTCEALDAEANVLFAAASDLSGHIPANTKTPIMRVSAIGLSLTIPIGPPSLTQMHPGKLSGENVISTVGRNL